MIVMAKEFKLVNKSGESLIKTRIETKELAIEFFAKIKRLSKIDLLKIYNVKEC